MIQRHQQLLRHKPEEGVHGDCFRTVVACILHLPPEEVPHVYDGTDDETGYERMRAFLRDRGFVLLQVVLNGTMTLEEILAYGARCSAGLPWLLTGESRNGTNHVVVCIGDQIAHDPAIDQSGIVGPTLEGAWWIEWIVRPAHQLEVAA
ncbi:hypothetical protein [Sinorhizobium fredii]|uniref:hypothetical protein n=1 Tax=Rhizobium fredii TaxID=380 RepID=UPI003518D82E